jgi:hypothetical protein
MSIAADKLAEVADFRAALPGANDGREGEDDSLPAERQDRPPAC